MNWMGGARSRIRQKEEKRKQQEFFSRMRLAKQLNEASATTLFTPSSMFFQTRQSYLNPNSVRVQNHSMDMNSSKPSTPRFRNDNQSDTQLALTRSNIMTPFDNVKRTTVSSAAFHTPRAVYQQSCKDNAEIIPRKVAEKNTRIGNVVDQCQSSPLDAWCHEVETHMSNSQFSGSQSQRNSEKGSQKSSFPENDWNRAMIVEDFQLDMPLKDKRSEFSSKPVNSNPFLFQHKNSHQKSRHLSLEHNEQRPEFPDFFSPFSTSNLSYAQTQRGSYNSKAQSSSSEVNSKSAESGFFYSSEAESENEDFDSVSVKRDEPEASHNHNQDIIFIDKTPSRETQAFCIPTPLSSKHIGFTKNEERVFSSSPLPNNNYFDVDELAGSQTNLTQVEKQQNDSIKKLREISEWNKPKTPILQLAPLFTDVSLYQDWLQKEIYSQLQYVHPKNRKYNSEDYRDSTSLEAAEVLPKSRETRNISTQTEASPEQSKIFLDKAVQIEQNDVIRHYFGLNRLCYSL